jgi:hypothetical protein
LKNHALLLFGPSSFEHWFKSCKSFTVKSLLFSQIPNQSSASFLPLSSSWRLCSPALFLVSLPPIQCLEFGRRRPPPVLPVHASVPCATTALAPSGWRPARAPRRLCAARAARRCPCRRRASEVHLPRWQPQTRAQLAVLPFAASFAYKRMPQASSRAHRNRRLLH